MIGVGFIHSREGEVFCKKILFREALSLSQIIHINRIMDINEIRDPREEITFHVVKASG